MMQGKVWQTYSQQYKSNYGSVSSVKAAVNILNRITKTRLGTSSRIPDSNDSVKYGFSFNEYWQVI